IAPRPAAALIAEPVDRMLGGYALAPVPARRAPEFPPAIAALLYERGELGVADGGFGDAERCDFDGVRPLLIVENEAIGRRRTELPAPAGHGDIALPRAGAIGGRTGEPVRPRISKRLARIGERLDMHVLVTDRKLVEIGGGDIDPAAKVVDLAAK